METVQVREVRKGDILVELWGYEQTNVDFLQVEEISPTGKSALCRMMSEREVGERQFLAEYVVPGTPNGEVFRMRVRGDTLVGSYPFCRGSKRLGYFSKWEGRPILQTHYH